MNKLTLLSAVVAATTCSASALAFRSGPPAGFTGSPADTISCMMCHGKTPGSGSVEILGLPASYQANQVYNLSVKVSDPNQLGAGFQLTVEDSEGAKVGTLLVVDNVNTWYSEAGMTPEWIHHTTVGVDNSVLDWAANGNSATYNIAWQAPAADIGTITFYAAGNAINNDFSNGDDIIYLTNVAMTFGASCPADLNGDGQVNSADLASLLGAWGSSGPADLDGNGQVNSADLASLLGAWGPC